MPSRLLSTLGRGLRKPPRVIARRLAQEAQKSLDRLLLPGRTRRGGASPVLAATRAANHVELWNRLSARRFWLPAKIDRAEYEVLCPGDAERILAAADRAIEHRVDLLGSGPIDLGPRIDWQRDYKSGFTWPRGYAPDIDYNNPDRPSDVKFPWELSRVQWLLPLGQAFQLTGDERYAAAARDVLEAWMLDNPVMQSVNWSCTMEIALRFLSCSWLFDALAHSAAWQETTFQKRLLESLFWHAVFTERYLERSDINGNHCTADAAAMTVAGLFFGQGRLPARWLARGWRLLCEELPRQVTADGVDFEGSIAYHRLVQELFLLPALLRERAGLDVPDEYRQRVVAMCRFTAAYTRADGSTPLWGDADDARALPLGGQVIGNHRYLLGLVGAAWNVDDLCESFSGSKAEVFWLLGAEACRRLANRTENTRCGTVGSQSFPDGGYYIMRGGGDHVFVDCGPVGLAGRGGHGHNDCLAFEAALDGVHLIGDCGAYVYTASYRERNLFRSTDYHNTPRIAGEEINRFNGPDQLWTLHNDAQPEVRRWTAGLMRDTFVGTHSGYTRLWPALRPVRTIVLDRARHALAVRDEFEGTNGRSLDVSIPWHLALGVRVVEARPGSFLLEAGSRRFLLQWFSPAPWSADVESARVSPSYGVALLTERIVWRLHSASPQPLQVGLAPWEAGTAEETSWIYSLLAEAHV